MLDRVLTELGRLGSKLDRYWLRQDTILERLRKMSKELDTLTSRVHDLSGLVDKVLAAVADLKQKVIDLAAAGGTPEQFVALTTEVEADIKRLNDGIAPAPAPEPVAKSKKK